MSTRLPSILLILLWFVPPLEARQSRSSQPDVGVDMRNVHLHVSDDAALDVTWIHGRLHSASPTGHRSSTTSPPFPWRSTMARLPSMPRA